MCDKPSFLYYKMIKKRDIGRGVGVYFLVILRYVTFERPHSIIIDFVVSDNLYDCYCCYFYSCLGADTSLG